MQMRDERKEVRICFGYLAGAVVILLIALMLTGCAGVAKYTIEKDDIKVTIFNTKDIGEIKAEALYNPETGEVLITLDEKSVSAAGPQAQQNDLLKDVLRLKIPGLPE